MKMETEELRKDIALIDEIETSFKLIKLGFGELQNFSPEHSFHYLPFQLLSSGFERFMKCYICLAYKNKNGQYPDFKYIKNIGHDLFELLCEINVKYFVVDDRPVTREDKEFLLDDEFLQLLNILSEFGKFARYHNLDIITGNKNVGINPKDDWQNFENEILKSNPHLYDKLMQLDESYEVFSFISTYIIKLFEQFLAALSRQLMFGHIGDRAKQLSISVFDFGMIYEKKLGKTDYRKLTTRYKEEPKKAHKRTFVDEMDRTTNRNYKSKKIIKSEYKGVWPFYSEEIIIENRFNHWCIVTIDGYDYALNGSAKGRYKLENPHDGGMQMPGTTTSEFLKLAREL